MLSYRRKRAAELSPEDWQAWQNLLAQQTDMIWQSPYFQAEFSHQVSRIRPDLQVLLLYAEQRLVGVLPYHRHSAWLATPVAEYLSDYHGPIIAPAFHAELNLSKLLRAMQVRRFSYNHLPKSWSQPAQAAWHSSRSLLLNLQQGYAAYQQELAAQRESGLFKKIATAKRKLEQKYGPIRFEFASQNQRDFEALLTGKSQQFCRTVGAAQDIFAQSWIRRLMDNLLACQKPEFAGVFSSLHAGDTLIAGHFGLRSATSLHYWFPWYDTEYAEFSPGLILLALCAEYAAEAGLQRIDLGRGEQAYKQRFATDYVELAEGVWSNPAILGRAESRYRVTKAQLRDSRLGQQLRALKQGLKTQSK